jgi:predicted lysophospholipase L1 biosynthesis ABC-type transport system permease subunit
VDAQPGTEVYFLLDQLTHVFGSGNAQLGAWEDGSMKIVMRSATPAAAIQSAIAAVVREANASLPIIRLRGMEDVISDSFRRPVMLLHLLSAFSVLAVVLAAIETYGVLSYVVAERRREIGIRMALGVRPQRIVGRVVGQALQLAAVGLVVGLAAAAGLTRLIETLLFGVPTTDVPTFGSAAVIGVAAAVSSLVPAYRAVRIDPVAALRPE